MKIGIQDVSLHSNGININIISDSRKSPLKINVMLGKRLNISCRQSIDSYQWEKNSLLG